jgi:hypothetical protein
MPSGRPRFHAEVPTEDIQWLEKIKGRAGRTGADAVT